MSDTLANAKLRFPWSSRSHSLPAVREITGRCQSTLIKIFKVFQDIDDILYVEVKRHIRENEGRYFEPPSLAPRVRLTKTDLAVVGEGKWHGSDPPTGFALGRLGDVSCILVWRKILDTLIEYQEKESWMLAKQRALDILQARDRIAPLFDDIQEELINELCESLHQKLNLLERFTAVYNAQRTSSIENDRPAWEPAYNTYDVPDLQKSRFVANAYPHLQPQPKHNATLIAVVCLVTVLSSVPAILAWNRSSNSAGTASDSDF